MANQGSEPTKRYAIIPGYVISENDGDLHYVTADQLIRLYRLPRQECVIIDERTAYYLHTHEPPLIVIAPSYDGKKYEAIHTKAERLERIQEAIANMTHLSERERYEVATSKQTKAKRQIEHENRWYSSGRMRRITESIRDRQKEQRKESPRNEN